MSDFALPWWMTEPPPTPEEGIKLIHRPGKLLLLIEDRRYYLRLIKDFISPTQLNMTLYMCQYQKEHFYVDSLNLADNSQRNALTQQAAEELNINKNLIADDLAWLVPQLEKYRDTFLQDTQEKIQQRPPVMQ